MQQMASQEVQISGLMTCNQELEQEILQLKRDINNLERENKQLINENRKLAYETVPEEVRERVRVAFAEKTKRASSSTEVFTFREKVMFRGIAILTGIGIGLVMLSSL